MQINWRGRLNRAPEELSPERRRAGNVILVALAVLALGGVWMASLSTPAPQAGASAPSTGVEWWPVVLAAVFELLGKASFWICVCILWGATIISDAVEKASKRLSDKADDIIDEVRTSPR